MDRIHFFEIHTASNLIVSEAFYLTGLTMPILLFPIAPFPTLWHSQILPSPLITCLGLYGL